MGWMITVIIDPMLAVLIWTLLVAMVVARVALGLGYILKPTALAQANAKARPRPMQPLG